MKPNNAAQIINRKPSMRTACLIAVACVMLLAASFSYAGLAKSRVIRVTAVDIAKLPATENYVVDLRQTGVAYDLDGTERAIDWNRVRIRRADGEVALVAHLRERYPKLAGMKPTRLVIGATDGIMEILKLKAAPNPGTDYSCDAKSKTCECVGATDCEFMLTSKVCNDDGAFCGVTIKNQMDCECGAK